MHFADFCRISFLFSLLIIALCYFVLETTFPLQPENLLYGSPADDAPLKIADFGLSKMLHNDTTMQTVCGTPGYCGELNYYS